MSPSDQLATAKSAAVSAVAHYNDLLKRVQATCEHPLVAECDYRSEGHFNYAEPPRRICEVCGVHEPGWGAGWQIFKHTTHTRRVSRDQLFSMRRELPDLS